MSTIKCPDCNLPTIWKEAESPCEDCGSHSAYECEDCGYQVDHVWNDKLYEAIDKELKNG